MKALEPSPPNLAPSKPLPLVLYVEDEDANWEVAELRLRQTYRLKRAVNDREAVLFACMHAPELAAILMDIQLSGSQLDGIKLTKLFKGTLPPDGLPTYARNCPPIDVPILFVTAYQARFSRAELTAAGGVGVVYKPVDFVALKLTLAQISVRRAMQSLTR